MFGISIGEFLLIGIVALMVIPARDWPKVFRAAARAFRWIRETVWSVRDKMDEIAEEVSKYDPSEALSKKTMDDMMATFAEPVKRKNKKESASPTVRKQSEIPAFAGMTNKKDALPRVDKLKKSKRGNADRVKNDDR
ncbi:MAG: hypothetical protein LBH81_01930 [Rickettsiales bacterium]|jgi:Sec-independent protein translocase protein TatA|nr:hypothetical protein [Rickettsiales bacterium]